MTDHSRLDARNWLWWAKVGFGWKLTLAKVGFDLSRLRSGEVALKLETDFVRSGEPGFDGPKSA